MSIGANWTRKGVLVRKSERARTDGWTERQTESMHTGVSPFNNCHFSFCLAYVGHIIQSVLGEGDAQFSRIFLTGLINSELYSQPFIK